MDQPYLNDIYANNLRALYLVREVARADYVLAMNLFGLSTVKDAQRIGRMDAMQLERLADSPEPLFVLRSPKTFTALLGQIDLGDAPDRIELTRLATMLAGNPAASREPPDTLQTTV